MLSEHHLPHSGRCAVQEHGALIDCLERSDMASAALQMEHHLTAVADRAFSEPLEAPAPARAGPMQDASMQGASVQDGAAPAELAQIDPG